MTDTERETHLGRMALAESMRKVDDGTITGRDVVALTEARNADTDAGGFDAYFSTFGTLNSHNEIILPGAYDNCADALVRDGWVCRDHDWSVGEHIGMIARSYKDKKGQRVDVVFHSDDEAQRVRTRMSERIAAGKTVKLSYAFDVNHDGYTVISGKDAVKHLSSTATKEERARCAKLSAVTLIHEVARCYEVSIVALPSEAHADVLQVRSDGDAVATRDHGIVLPNLDRQITFAALCGIADALVYRAFYSALYCSDETMTKADKVEYIRKAFEEAGALATKVVDGILDDDDEIEESRAALRALFGDDPDEASATRERTRFSTQIDAALDAATSTLDRASAIEALRLREGGKFNHSDAMLAFATRATALADSARAIAERNTPKPVADQNALAMQLLALRAKHSPLAID